jgi:hypothetical protein
MAGSLRRTRLVSFRLSEDDYNALRRLSEARGARNLSDFVRSTVCAILPAGHEQPVIEVHKKLRELKMRMAELDQIAEGLAVLVGDLASGKGKKGAA